ncbi:GerMN domain-containing protein [Clostridium sp. D2Q-14]|uniref:GerMN domain-containing protein n=1 Tax=Anaeromonas gelatinilytica TaxID=2683194 RepID=UPI00193C5AAC|nr:GerMN domain-containing protein [Anaeromonas gelatinilytica]MBS4535841.1 GerMN domain-containing protein [Anaeromonas gelatinilytica]
MNKSFFIILLSILLILLIIGCQKYDDFDNLGENTQIISPYSTENDFDVALYYPDLSLSRLVRKDIKIKNITNSIEMEVLQRLIRGINDENIVNLIPRNTKVLSVEVSDQIAYINFSKDIIEKDITQEEEALLIYSIVNTMTELDSINSVQILINGERKDIFLNYYNIENPLKYSKLIVKEDYVNPINTIEKYYKMVREKDAANLVGVFTKSERKDKIAYTIKHIEKNIDGYNVKSYIINNYEYSNLIDVEIEVITSEGKSINKNEVFSLVYSNEQNIFKINEIYE